MEVISGKDNQIMLQDVALPSLRSWNLWNQALNIHNGIVSDTDGRRR